MAHTQEKKSFDRNKPQGNSELADKYFIVVIINMFNDLKKNISIMSEQIGKSNQSNRNIFFFLRTK